MLICVNADASDVPWEEMIDALDAVSPLLEDVRPGLVFADMHGIAGDARAWIAQISGVA